MLKRDLIELCEIRFCHKYPGGRVLASSTISKLVNSAGSFLDKKYTRQNAVLSGGNVSEIWSQIGTFTSQIPGMIVSRGTDFENKCGE
jgi:hypothetical protein